jgi:hypothetical protein
MSAAESIIFPRSHVRHSMPGDTWLLLPTVRQSDIDELAALGVTPEMCMRGGMEHSRRSFTLFIQGEPAAMFGCVEHETHGVPWMVICEAAARHPIPFLRCTRSYAESLDMFLENRVDARNTHVVRWLRWLGFMVDEAIPWGLHGEPFHRFWRSTTKETPCATGG